MTTYSLTHLSDGTLIRDLKAIVARDCANTAGMLARIAEVDARRLYLPAGFPSMFLYCIRELKFSEDAAYKRITAARTARSFPAVFAAVAEGRLHLSGVVLLAPHLTERTAVDLLAAAEHKTKAEIERLLAEHFPKPDLPSRLEALPSHRAAQGPADASTRHVTVEPAPAEPAQLAPGRVEDVGLLSRPIQFEPVSAESRLGQSRGASSRMTPLGPQRFGLQVTLDQETHDLLRYAQELVSHTVPSNDLPEVIRRALALYVRHLEKHKFAATSTPRRSQRPSAEGRHVPSHVKRAVWERDGGCCTFVSDTGQRCASRTLLEFDHVDPVARGGRASVSGIRLRCRAHNQHAAECTFGAGFIREKRKQARRVAEARRQASRRAGEPSRGAADAARSLT